jgi:hypothetical protein
VTEPSLRVEHSSGYGARLVTARPVRRGEVIAPIRRFRKTGAPTRHSIQTGPDSHIDDLGDLRYLNHSCAPTVLVDTERLEVVAARDLAAGDELTFFYPSTEWEMAQPFACLCGASQCLGTVSGARDLAPDLLGRYALNPHIRTLLAARPPIQARPPTQKRGA